MKAVRVGWDESDFCAGLMSWINAGNGGFRIKIVLYF